MLQHPGGETPPQDVPAGGRAVFGAPYPAYTVTEEDIAAGVVTVLFAVPTLGLERELRFDCATGLPLA